MSKKNYRVKARRKLLCKKSEMKKKLDEEREKIKVIFGAMFEINGLQGDNLASNHPQLEAAGLWTFIHKEWEQPDVKIMKAFIISSRFGTEDSFVVEGKTRQFDAATVAKALQLPLSGPNLDELDKKDLSTAEKKEIFVGGSKAKKPQGWELAQTKGLWRDCL